MLPDRHLQLLTAYVDGELSPRRRRLAEQLLARSEEARTLLNQLQADSRHLIQLPATPAPADLSAAVMSRVAATKRRPWRTPERRPQPRPFPMWAGWSAAAAVLLAVTFGTLMQYSGSTPETPGVAKKNKREQPQSGGPGETEIAQQLPMPMPSEDNEPQPQPDDGKTPEQMPLRKPPVLPQPVEVEKPKRATDSILAASGNDSDVRIERVQVALPVLLKLHELDGKDEVGRLRTQLMGQSGVRVELLAKNATHGFDRVKSALQANKVTLVIDPAAQTKLKSPQFVQNYGVFLENVPAETLVSILTAAGVADRTAGAKKAAEMRFDGPVIVQGLGEKDKELTTMIGLDPVRVRPVPVKPTEVDIRKPLSDQTPGQVDEILDGKQAPRPNTAPADLTAMVLPLSGTTRRSAELKRYLDGRIPPRAGTLQVFLVLRQLTN